MSFTAQDVMKLRERTGAGLMSAKKALTETNGDMEKAIDLLRISGEAKAAKKADRETKEGAVYVLYTPDNSKGAIVSLYCETDFVARNEDFKKLLNAITEVALAQGEEAARTFADSKLKEAIVTSGENMQIGDIRVISGAYVNGYVHSNNKTGAIVSLSAKNETVGRNVAMHIVASSPKCLSAADLSQEDIAHEKTIWKQQLADEGKPEQIIDKIIEGKVKKYASEVALLEQTFVMNPEQTVNQYVSADGVSVISFVHLTA